MGAATIDHPSPTMMFKNHWVLITNQDMTDDKKVVIHRQGISPK